MSDEVIPTPDAAPPVKRGRGRPKGSRNKVSKDAQRFFEKLWKRPEFRRKFLKDWDGGRLAPAVVVAAAHYAFGKPVDQVNINSDTPLAPTAVVLVLNGEQITSGDGDPGSGT